MAHTPTPDDVEHTVFFIKWYQEILGGLILMLTGLFFKAKGKSAHQAIIPMSEAEIDHRMTICKQSVIIAMNELIQDHEDREVERLDKRDVSLLQHIKDIIEAGR